MLHRTTSQIKTNREYSTTALVKCFSEDFYKPDSSEANGGTILQQEKIVDVLLIRFNNKDLSGLAPAFHAVVRFHT